MNFNFNINKAYSLLTEKLENWVASAIKMLPNLVVAILVLVLFVVIGKFIKKILQRLFRRIIDNTSLQNLLSSIIYLIIVAIGTFVALSILNLDGAVTSLLAGAGVIGLALGFAFQEIASNFIAGTMMTFRKPFRPGDLIETNDFFGKVVHIHLRVTEILTLQGQTVLIPNAQVFKNPIKNYTQTGRRRIDITVGVTYDQDLPFAKKIAREAIANLEGIDKDDITIFYKGFNDSSIDFDIRYWIPFTNKNFEYLSKRDEGVIAIKQAFDKNGISIPFPIRTLDISEDIIRTIVTAKTQENSGKETQENSNQNDVSPNENSRENEA